MIACVRNIWTWFIFPVGWNLLDGGGHGSLNRMLNVERHPNKRLRRGSGAEESEATLGHIVRQCCKTKPNQTSSGEMTLWYECFRTSVSASSTHIKLGVVAHTCLSFQRDRQITG